MGLRPNLYQEGEFTLKRKITSDNRTVDAQSTAGCIVVNRQFIIQLLTMWLQNSVTTKLS